MEQRGWNRREFVGAAALAALVLGLPSAAHAVNELDAADAPSSRQLEMMDEVAELVIPTTDTPGGRAAGVGPFVLLALAHGLDGTRQALASDAVSTAIRQHLRRDGSLDYAGWLEVTLDRAAGGDWLAGTPQLRRTSLAALDAEAFAPGSEGHPWRKLKNLVLTGYYTSEIGGSQELLYEPLPGRFDPAVPLKAGDRAYSNEWTGVEFG